MKSLFLTLIVIAGSIGVNAQSQLRVNNHTSCPVYFSTLLSTATNSCGAPHTGSFVIMLPPGGSVLYTNTTYPGYTDPTYVNFYNMRIYNGPGHCGTPVHLGLSCSPPPKHCYNLFIAKLQSMWNWNSYLDTYG